MVKVSDLEFLAPNLTQDTMRSIYALAWQSGSPDLLSVLNLLWNLSNGQATTHAGWTGSRAAICGDYVSLFGLSEAQPQSNVPLAIERLSRCPILETWSFTKISAVYHRVFRTVPLIGTACLAYYFSWKCPRFREMLLNNFPWSPEKSIFGDYHYLLTEYEKFRGYPPSPEIDEILFALACWISSPSLKEFRQISRDIWEDWLGRIYTSTDPIPHASINRILGEGCSVDSQQLKLDRALAMLETNEVMEF